ncbi:protein serine/threonine phosphatase 2C [Fomitiporia mediterranea MF3/22]|uniref:protein serine/threonine phosphatase 2C n=1 Tax=Fomitiporia mediterranea (strain MF3/22) TaxID=694068 RepID=UPI00044084DF|nr:protein serine/threonine phosphatase 2C [Fomitiporia mediterranea MF3/22]EJD04167.1 protein serine/threonine phosphatase 2C [Fomitiporia mediterranea MF3/22]
MTTVEKPRAEDLAACYHLLSDTHDRYLGLQNGGATIRGGALRIPLGSPRVIGIAEARGNRPQQQDSHQFATLTLNPEELRLSVKKSFGIDWDPGAVGDEFARQVVFVGVYDGHGGQGVSLFLHQNLHGLFESVDKSQIPDVFAWTKELGGYFRRFRGGVLQPWLTRPPSEQEMDLEARATLAFLEADRVVHESKTCGATASVALLQSLDVPATPFFAAETVALTVAHVGDTRLILCSRDGGHPLRMTHDHHAEAPGESARLRRWGSSRLVMDSFGETRWMGALANTRGIGDMDYKQYGVTAEPEVTTKLLHGPEWAYMVLVTDGISSVLSDAEIVDLARNAKDPKAAAKAILDFADEIGSEDNLTALVVPLAGWGQVTGPDMTKELREYRRTEAIGTERHRRM